jgi:hypothetical protein
MVVLFAMPLFAGDTAPAPKPSSYAPAADLASQIESFIKQIDADLASEAEYGADQKSRVAKDANTLIALAQVLANHDEDHPLRKAAPAVVKTARDLADAADEFADAKKALAAVKESLRSMAGGQANWEPAAELGQLMKQVPIVNNRLRAGVTGKRFDRLIEQNAGLATTLAAMAQVSTYDKAYCSSKEEESTWEKVCGDMRSAAADVQVAVRKKDVAAARDGLEKLVKTCDACHADFRD